MLKLSNLTNLLMFGCNSSFVAGNKIYELHVIELFSVSHVNKNDKIHVNFAICRPNI